MAEKDHWRASQGRQDLYNAIADILRQGHLLQYADIDGMLPFYGYSPQTDSHNIFSNPTTKKSLASRGVKLQKDNYRRRVLFRDGNLTANDTDMILTHELIDSEYEESIARRMLGDKFTTEGRVIESKYRLMGLETRRFVDPSGTIYKPHRHGGVRIFTTAGSSAVRLDEGEWRQLLPGQEIIIGDGQLHEANVNTKEDWGYILATTSEEMQARGLQK